MRTTHVGRNFSSATLPELKFRPTYGLWHDSIGPTVTSRSIRFLAATALALCGPELVAQTPQFRAGVDLVVIDAVVLDNKGEPVSTLTADDFVIKAGGRPRKIVSAQYVRVTQPTGGTTVSSMDATIAAVPVATSNQVPHTGRSFVIVADTNGITAGNGHLVFDRISTFVGGLNAEDLVGLAVLPGGKPRVDLTTDHARVRDAAQRIVGWNPPATTTMSPGEAAMIARGDMDTLTAYLDRIGSGPGVIRDRKVCRNPASGRPVSGGAGGTQVDPSFDMTDCSSVAEQALDQYRRQSNAVLETLGALAEAISPIEGPKTLVFVSEGLSIDGRNNDQLQNFARKAEAARVTLYALQPQIALMEASSNGGPTATARLLDRQFGLDGLASTAVAARGAAFSIAGTADFALKQIDRESSGYYLLAFERDDKDKDNARVPIDVKVNRPGFDVRARSSVTPKPTTASATSKVPADSKAAIGELIRWPLAVPDLAMDADVYVTRRDATATKAQALVAVEFAPASVAIDVTGFEVTDANGDGVLDNFEQQPTTITRANGRRLYLGALPLDPGTYTLKFAAIDKSGRRGSIERRFAVSDAATDTIRVSDVIFGDSSSGAFVPIATIGAEFGAAIDVMLPSTPSPTSPRVLLSLIDGKAHGVSRNELTLSSTSDSGRFRAVATLKTADLPSGDYVVKFELMIGSTVIAERSRRFTKP